MTEIESGYVEEICMKLKYGEYELVFDEGGVRIEKRGVGLYSNRRPMFVYVKTKEAVTEFYDAAYVHTEAVAGGVLCTGSVATPGGSVFSFADVYEILENELKISRKVVVEKAGEELGFSTKISFVMEQSSDPKLYQCFAPGVWYKQNEYAPARSIGKDLDAEYFWQWETRCGLPMFAMRHMETGESICFSRWAADVTMRNLGLALSENAVDKQFTIGSVGMSRPQSKTLNYLYYGYAVRKEVPTPCEGLSIDYVYPGAEGETPKSDFYASMNFAIRSKNFNRVYHPVEKGFRQEYAVALHMEEYQSFQFMMKDTWRMVYARLRDKIFSVDNKQHFKNCMKFLKRMTSRYGDAYGLPFAAQLPDLDISSVSFQFGFVGQQPGIGYQLLRYGDMEGDAEAYEKGFGLLDFWVRRSMTEWGVPNVCYHPAIDSFEPYPFWTRMIADGMEAILDAYLYLHKRGREQAAWLEYCIRVADWYIRIQNEDGSYYRSYKEGSSMNMDSKANTPSPIRFLVQMFLVTGQEGYKEAALKAGEWSYVNLYENMEYRGGTCDNLDITDKEAGIYALFGFLALYDLTGEEKWLEAARGAADYTETWTYAWSFPVVSPYAVHPFNRYSISGQSIITIGGGADVYMAACSYTYYRLYLLTGDCHYRDFAEFIHKNTRQSNDVDGSVGYRYPGVGHESGNFATQVLNSHYHWLPWCTFVQVDPISRMVDTFGVYEIADAEKLSAEERKKRNRIYNGYAG